MPLQLDDYDVSILRSLVKDGRKSFRKISREEDKHRVVKEYSFVKEYDYENEYANLIIKNNLSPETLSASSNQDIIRKEPGLLQITKADFAYEFAN